MSETVELIADALRLELANSEKRVAFAEYNYVGAKMKLADIEGRRAVLFTTAFEHVEQGKLHARFGELSQRERDLMRAIARYVAIGRTDQ